jgi:hypothetical protein
MAEIAKWKTTLHLDAEMRDNIPRSISLSAILRICMAALTTDDEGFQKYVDTHKDAKDAIKWVQPRLKKLVRMK